LRRKCRVLAQSDSYTGIYRLKKKGKEEIGPKNMKRVNKKGVTFSFIQPSSDLINGNHSAITRIIVTWHSYHRRQQSHLLFKVHCNRILAENQI
jgi:hypothetical protein